MSFTIVHQQRGDFYDLCVLRTADNITLNTNVSTLSDIATKNPAFGFHCTIVGWGYQNASQSNPLKYDTVRVVNDSKCKADYGELFKPGYEICAGWLGNKDWDTLLFDKGRPLICDGELAGFAGNNIYGQFIVANNISGFYASIQPIREWLNTTVHKDNAESG